DVFQRNRNAVEWAQRLPFRAPRIRSMGRRQGFLRTDGYESSQTAVEVFDPLQDSADDLGGGQVAGTNGLDECADIRPTDLIAMHASASRSFRQGQLLRLRPRARI